MAKSYDDLEFAQKLMIDSYGVDSTVPLSVKQGKLKNQKWVYEDKTNASLADVMTQYWKKVETDLRLNKDYATIHKSDPHMLQQPYLFDKKPPGAPNTYPFLEKKSSYTDDDIKNMDYMHNLIKMLHNKDKTIGTSLMDEIKNNTLMLREDPNTMINRKKHYDELANYELQRLFVRGTKRKILYAEPVLQPSIYIDTRKETFDSAYYNVAKLITMTADFTVNKKDDFHPGTRLQRYHNSLYARAQGMLNKISSKQEAINQYRIRHIRREWEHYANMFNYDFMHLPPGYDPLPPTNCWISKTNIKFLKIDRSYHNQLLTKDWDIEDYLYFDPTLLEDAAGYEAWKVWAEKEKKQYAKLCMEEFEKPSDWTLGAGALRLEPGPPFKLNKLGRFRKAGKKARAWSAPSTSSTPPPQTPPAINTPQTPPAINPPPTPPATNILQAAVDQHILDIRATADKPALDALVNANSTTINGVVRNQLTVAQQTSIGQAILAQEAIFRATPPVTPANSAPPSPQQQPPAQQPFSFAKTKYFGEMNVKYKIRKTQKGNVLEMVNVFANQPKGSQASSMVKSIINYYKGQNKPIDYIILSPYLLNDEGLLNYYQQKWDMDIAVVGEDVKQTNLGSLVAKRDNAKISDWIAKVNLGKSDWESTWMIVSVEDLLETPMFKDACGIGGKGGLKVLKKKGDPIDITVDEFKEIVETTFLSDSSGNPIDLTSITDATMKMELQRMIQPNINEPELLFFHRGPVDKAACVTATKCEQEYTDRKDLILNNIANGTYEFDLGVGISLLAPDTPYKFDVKGMARLLESCKGTACPPNQMACGAEHPEVVERFAKEILQKYKTPSTGKLNKKGRELMESNLQKKLKDKAAAILKKVTDKNWTLVLDAGVLKLKEENGTFIPVTKDKIELFLKGKFEPDTVPNGLRRIINHFAVDSTFNAIVKPVAEELLQKLLSQAPAPASIEPESLVEDAQGLQELKVIRLTKDPTYEEDNIRKCCRFTFKLGDGDNEETYYVRTYDPKKEPDHHSFVSELEKCYQKNQKENKNRSKQDRRTRSSLFPHLMPLHLFTEFNSVGEVVTVKKKSDIGGKINGEDKFRGLKLKFPNQSDAPFVDKDNKKTRYFYIQKKRGDSVKKWLEDTYYDLNGNTITKMKETNFGKALERLKAPVDDIEKIRKGVEKALEELHKINDCENNKETFRFLHRDIKIDNVAVELNSSGKVKRVRLFDYNAVVDTNKSNWTTLAKERKQLPMRNGTYDSKAKTVTSTGDGSLMDRYIAKQQFNKIPKANLKMLDYHQAGMMLLQLGGIFDWVPDYKWDAPTDFANFGTRVEDPGKRMMFDKHKTFLKNSSDQRLEGYDTETVANFWENILRKGKQRLENGAFTYGNRKKDDLEAQTVRADWFISKCRRLDETKYNQTVPIAQDVWNLSSEFVVKVFNEFFKTQNEIMNLSSGSVGGGGAGITSPIQFLSQARQPVFERIQIQSDYGDDEDLEALMEFDPDLDGVELEKMSPSSHISDEEFERMLNETTNYDALSEHIARENKAYSDHSTDMEVEEDAKSISSKHSSNSVASIASQMSNMSSHSVASNMSAQSGVSVASAISVASNLSEKSNASTMSNMSHHSYTSNHSVESEEAYPTSEHSEQSYGGYSELSYNNNTSGFSNSSSHSSSESSGKEMGYTNGLSESSDHGMSESSDHESSNESMGYSSSGGSSSNNHSYNSSSDTE